MYRIYLVEDDVIIARSIKKHLENWEYEVQCTKDFSAVTKEFAEFAPQLVLMDIGLPFYNGYYWCGEIRIKSSDSLSVFGIGQYEHCHGSKHGSG
mgnify:CR=1 FL=1